MALDVHPLRARERHDGVTGDEVVVAPGRLDGAPFHLVLGGEVVELAARPFRVAGVVQQSDCTAAPMRRPLAAAAARSVSVEGGNAGGGVGAEGVSRPPHAAATPSAASTTATRGPRVKGIALLLCKE